LVRRLLTEDESAKTEPNAPHVEQDLAARIGYRVKVSVSPRGDGSLTIWFNDLFQFDDVVARLTERAAGESGEEG